jgi:hypothetical protein
MPETIDPDIRRDAIVAAYGQAVARCFLVLCERDPDQAAQERFARGMANADKALAIALMPTPDADPSKTAARPKRRSSA